MWPSAVFWVLLRKFCIILLYSRLLSLLKGKHRCSMPRLAEPWSRWQMVWSLSQHSCLHGHHTGPTGISPCLYAEHVEVPVHFSCFALMSWMSLAGRPHVIKRTQLAILVYTAVRLEDCVILQLLWQLSVFCVKESAHLCTGWAKLRGQYLVQ